MRRFWPGSSATWIQKILPDKGRIFCGPVPGVVGGGHRSSLLPFPPEQKNDRAQGKLRQEQAKCYSRESYITSKRQHVLGGIDCGDGNLPAAILGELTFKGRLRQKCVALRDRRLCEEVINVVVSNADTKAGELSFIGEYSWLGSAMRKERLLRRTDAIKTDPACAPHVLRALPHPLARGL